MTGEGDGSDGSDPDGQRRDAGGPATPQGTDQASRPASDAGWSTRRQILVGGGAVFGFWYLFVRESDDDETRASSTAASGSGSSDPEAVVISFVERVQSEETESATELLYDDVETLPNLLGNWYDDYTEGDFVNMETNILTEESGAVEIELIYNDNNHHDPHYGFGSLFYLQSTGTGWQITDFVGSHMGEAFD